MFIRSFIIPIAIVAILTGVLHVLAIELYLYWTLKWFDIPMHFLGGLWVALTAFWFLFIYRIFPFIPQTTRVALIALLLSALFVGLLWEIFEYVTKTAGEGNYVRDLISDFIMDAIGAFAAYFYVLKSRYRTVLE